MKRTLTLLAFAIILFSCKNDSGTGLKGKDTTTQRVPVDTTFPIGIFLSPDSTQIRNEVLARIVTVTKVWVGDTTQFKILKQQKDSFYFAMGSMPLTDNATGKPILDSTGKQKILEGYIMPIDKSLVWDTGIMRDSAHNRFKPLLKIIPAPQKK